MAKLSKLVEVLAASLGVSEQEIRQYARHAREAGLLVQGSRGTAAPEVGLRDGANLLMAYLGGNLAKNASNTISALRPLTTWIPINSEEQCRYSDEFKKRYGWIYRNIDFGTALERLLSLSFMKEHFNSINIGDGCIDNKFISFWIEFEQRPSRASIILCNCDEAEEVGDWDSNEIMKKFYFYDDFIASVAFGPNESGPTEKEMTRSRFTIINRISQDVIHDLSLCIRR